MNLGELLAELRENILRDVTDAVVADAGDYLFSDRSLVRYINDGEVKFASQTLCLRDETTAPITRITLVPGQETYALDPRVVSLFGARIGTRHLRRTMYSALVQRTSGAPCVGTPAVVYTDRESGKVGVYPAPSAELAGEQLVLRVARTPLNPLTAANLGASPEIPEEFHLDILEWAAWRALRNHDADVENMNKASAHKKRFVDTTDELARQAKRLLAQEIQFGLDTNWR